MDNFKREIFDKLGNLFYAIAKDQHVAPIEFGELKMLMRKDWLTEIPEVSGSGVSEPSHLIVLAMDSLLGQATPSENAFNSFTRFYGMHREQFSDALKGKIIDTANAIINVFPSAARLQNNHLIKLKLLFDNSSLIPLM
jgi:hypothetical protein